MYNDSLKKAVTVHGIDKVRVTFPMRPVTSLAAIGLPIGVTSSSDPMVPQICIIDESQFKLDDDHKVVLRALDSTYGQEELYRMDLSSMLREIPQHVKVLIAQDDGSFIDFEEPKES